MAWQEIEGSRRTKSHSPAYIDYIIEFKGIYGTDTRPGNSYTYADVTGSGSLPSNNLIRSPRIAWSSEVRRHTILECRVTCVFRGYFAWRTGETHANYSEIHPRIIQRVGATAWQCTRKFHCDDSYSSTLATNLYYGYMPNFSGDYIPQCTNTQVVSGLEWARDLVVAQYETLPPINTLRPRVEGDTQWEKFDLVINKYDKLIRVANDAGVEDDGIHEVKTLSGDTARPKPNTRVYLEGLTTLPPNGYMQWQGYYNNADMTELGPLGTAKTLLLWHVSYKFVERLGAYWSSFMFLYLPRGWNLQYSVMQGVLVAQAKLVCSHNGTDVDLDFSKFVPRWMPGEFVDPTFSHGAPIMHSGAAQPHNFSELAGMIRWPT